MVWVCPPETHYIWWNKTVYRSTDLCRLPEPVTHVLSQQSSHIIAQLHACTFGHEFDRLPGDLGEAALLPVRHAHGEHPKAGKEKNLTLTRTFVTQTNRQKASVEVDRYSRDPDAPVRHH